MPKVTNFADIPEQKTFEPAPAGNYWLELVDHSEGEVASGKNEGSTRYTAIFEITDADDESQNGKRVYENLTWIEDTMPRVKGMLKSFASAQGQDLDPEDDEIDFEFDDLLGQKLFAKVRVVPASKDKKTGNEYPAKNAITKYLMAEDAS